MNFKLAILIDGGFLTKALAVRNRKFPDSREVEVECERIRKHPDLAGLDLLRIYFYDSPPAGGVLRNPIDGSILDLGRSPIHLRHEKLLNEIELLPNFALRRGELIARREGVRVYLDHLGLPIRRELRVHADIVI